MRDFRRLERRAPAIAISFGYPDGQKIPREEMLAAVRRIAEAVEVPVTADVEAGFGSTPEEVADTARAVIAAGAVGMNLEDGVEGKPDSLADVNLQKEIIRAVMEAVAGRRCSLRAECAHRYFSVRHRPGGNAAGAHDRAAERVSRGRSAVALRSRREGHGNDRAIGARSCRTIEHPGDGWHAASRGACSNSASRA